VRSHIGGGDSDYDARHAVDSDAAQQAARADRLRRPLSADPLGGLAIRVMRTETFYRWSLVLPVAIPTCAAALVWVLRVKFDAGGPIAVLLLSLNCGGIPYLIGGIALFAWLRRKSAATMTRVSYWTPVILMPLFWLWMVAVTWPTAIHQEPSVVLSVIGYFSAWWLGFGYLYVALVHLARFASDALGWLS
jgi:ABC-type sugar transport system permease subunit